MSMSLFVQKFGPRFYKERDPIIRGGGGGNLKPGAIEAMRKAIVTYINPLLLATATGFAVSFYSFFANVSKENAAYIRGYEGGFNFGADLARRRLIESPEYRFGQQLLLKIQENDTDLYNKMIMEFNEHGELSDETVLRIYAFLKAMLSEQTNPSNVDGQESVNLPFNFDNNSAQLENLGELESLIDLKEFRQALAGNVYTVMHRRYLYLYLSDSEKKFYMTDPAKFVIKVDPKLFDFLQNLNKNSGSTILVNNVNLSDFPLGSLIEVYGKGRDGDIVIIELKKSNGETVYVGEITEKSEKAHYDTYSITRGDIDTIIDKKTMESEFGKELQRDFPGINLQELKQFLSGFLYRVGLNYPHYIELKGDKYPDIREPDTLVLNVNNELVRSFLEKNQNQFRVLVNGVDITDQLLFDKTIFVPRIFDGSPRDLVVSIQDTKSGRVYDIAQAYKKENVNDPLYDLEIFRPGDPEDADTVAELSEVLPNVDQFELAKFLHKLLEVDAASYDQDGKRIGMFIFTRELYQYLEQNPSLRIFIDGVDVTDSLLALFGESSQGKEYDFWQVPLEYGNVEVGNSENPNNRVNVGLLEIRN